MSCCRSGDLKKGGTHLSAGKPPVTLLVRAFYTDLSLTDACVILHKKEVLETLEREPRNSRDDSTSKNVKESLDLDHIDKVPTKGPSKLLLGSGGQRH